MRKEVYVLVIILIVLFLNSCTKPVPVESAPEKEALEENETEVIIPE
ncbi:MAG: hypothetical protein Q8O03_01070 [Nanoarchaeota archaeon]|nr:hypothetical protein [Nanoarchaeota archaeon]